MFLARNGGSRQMSREKSKLLGRLSKCANALTYVRVYFYTNSLWSYE